MFQFHPGTPTAATDVFNFANGFSRIMNYAAEEASVLGADGRGVGALNGSGVEKGPILIHSFLLSFFAAAASAAAALCSSLHSLSLPQRRESQWAPIKSRATAVCQELGM